MLERNYYTPDGEEGIQAVVNDIENHPYSEYIIEGFYYVLEHELKDTEWNEPALLYAISILYFNDKKTYFEWIARYIEKGREILGEKIIN